MLYFKLKIGNIILFCVILLVSSCGTSKRLPEVAPVTLESQVIASPVFSKIFTGFALFDPSLDSMLFSHQADKYYTPASNTKLFTFYTTLKVLGDSIPLYRYHQRPGITILQGMGNPMFMHPDFPVDSNWIKQIMNLPGDKYYSADNFLDERLGPGWSWGDYAYGYQPEKSPFPIYGNMIRVEKDSASTGFKVQPKAFQSSFYYDPALDQFDYPVILREEANNQFAYNKKSRSATEFSLDRPFYQAKGQFTRLLNHEMTTRFKKYTFAPIDSSLQFQEVWSVLPDTLLKKFMQESDNFIGEQLLLSCSAKLFDGQLSSEKVIAYAQDSLLYDLPDPIRWVDGSGLSRYNLFTPRSIIALLNKLYKDYPEEWLFEMLPNGGKSGTISNWYGGKETPYVFAKTGTLSNKHCLSGYIKTKSGKVLLFSFMHNNYIGSSTPIKREMQQVLEWIWDNY